MQQPIWQIWIALIEYENWILTLVAMQKFMPYTALCLQVDYPITSEAVINSTPQKKDCVNIKACYLKARENGLVYRQQGVHSYDKLWTEVV